VNRPSRRAVVAAVCVGQLLLVGAAVAPRLSARLLGEEYRLAVAPVDPIDPFRGAYVALSYPGLPREDASGDAGDVYVPLVRDGDVWRGVRLDRRRPAGPPYLACVSSGYAVRCGIESLFASQNQARRLEAALAGGEAVATIRVDRRGHAAVVSVEGDAA
jgi:uncharacterized membrane-anchored protein